jgi:hypothetical protein
MPQNSGAFIKPTCFEEISEEMERQHFLAFKILWFFVLFENELKNDLGCFVEHTDNINLWLYAEISNIFICVFLFL